MRAIELTGPSLDSFRVTTLPDPKPGRGEVLVRLRAASLNFIDLAIATGNYPVSFPLIPIADGAGEVVELGAGVNDFVPGERVVLHTKPLWIAGPTSAQTSTAMRGATLPGSAAEYAVLPATALVRTPSHLTDAAAATLPITATTAWNALRAARVRPGTVVVLLGTGGVSIMALQLAKASGATVIVTSSSDQKLERAKKLGADFVINYKRTPDWDSQVLELTGGLGADLVLETVGGETFSKSLRAAAYGGTVFTIGFVTGTQTSTDILPIILKSLTVVGNNTGSVADLSDAARAIAAHAISPIVDETFAVGETAKAYAHFARAQHFGKIGIIH